MLTAEEKQARLSGVGASEVSAVLGSNDYMDDKDLLAIKTGQMFDFTGNQYTEWGERLEDDIADWYTDTFGGVASKSKVIWSLHLPFAFCTPDRVIDRGQLKHGLECKNKAYSQKPKWKQGPPDAVVDQVRWSMFVTGYERWDVAVLFNGNDPKSWTFHRERQWEEQAVPLVTEFWAKVEKANRKLWG